MNWQQLSATSHYKTALAVKNKIEIVSSEEVFNNDYNLD